MSLPPLDVPGLLRRYGLRPDKRLGQNFLIDPAALRQVVEAAGVQADSAVLEIGPGLGSLTRVLAEAAGWVVAVELDARLLPPLQDSLAPFDNVTLVQGDILALDPGELMSGAGRSAQTGSLDQAERQTQSGKPDPYLVVANIPYYITSAVIRHLLEAEVKPERLVLTVQREVAERIVAGPGEMSLLALSVQVYGEPRIAARIPAGAFYPAPQVDSAVVRVDLAPEPRFPPAKRELFFRLAKAGFSQKRKTLRNALAGGLQWPPEEASALLGTAEIDPQRRAETLSLDEWERLVESYTRRGV